MTKSEAHDLLRQHDGWGGIEAWIAARSWKVAPKGWTVEGELAGVAVPGGARPGRASGQRGNARAGTGDMGGFDAVRAALPVGSCEPRSDGRVILWASAASAAPPDAAGRVTMAFAPGLPSPRMPP